MSEHAIAIDPQSVVELSLVDLAYQILKSTNKPFHYRDLMQVVARLKGLTEQQVNEVIARLYTEINIDGRFICIGGNVWGLKRWYPTEKAGTEKAAVGKKFVRKDLDDDDDDDFYDDDEEIEDDADADDSPFGEYADGEEHGAAAKKFEEEDDEEEAAEDADAPVVEEEEEDLDNYEDDDHF